MLPLKLPVSMCSRDKVVEQNLSTMSFQVLGECKGEGLVICLESKLKNLMTS